MIGPSPWSEVMKVRERKENKRGGYYIIALNLF